MSFIQKFRDSLIILQLVVKQIPSYIKDTNHFINKVNSFFVPVNLVLVTMNVRSLWTSIPNSKKVWQLKLVSAIFYQIFIFSQNDSLLKTVKNKVFFHLKSSFRSWDIQIFVIFSLSIHTFQIQKDKWKWNNLWCHELTCINLQM